jgi:hypothetical protein
MVLSDSIDKNLKERNSYIFKKTDSDEEITLKIVSSRDISEPDAELEALAEEKDCTPGDKESQELESSGIFMRFCRDEQKKFPYLLVVKRGSRFTLLITGYHTDFVSVNDFMKKLTYEPEILQ